QVGLTSDFWCESAMDLIHLLILLSIISFGRSYEKKHQDPNDGFYIIAHMTNNERAADWAINAGANAIEMDLYFNPTTGSPTQFSHNFICDCTFIFNTAGTVCQELKSCDDGSSYDKQMNFLLNYPTLALIYIDSKVSDLSIQAQKLAGHQIIMAVEKMFQRGYKGKMVISSAREREYLIAAAEQSKVSKYKSQIFFMLDMDNSGTVATLEFLQKLDSLNIIYSIGCASFNLISTYYNQVKLAAINKAHGSVSNVFTWTVDIESRFDEYYISGARGIITNKVEDMVAWAKNKDLHLATPGDLSLQPTYNSKIIATIGTCSCLYTVSGCRISNPAPEYSACKCKLLWLTTICIGDVFPCKNQQSPFCHKPDTTIGSCRLGSGNCDGYD
ncbi:unnamed protein product, partial [Meganyctiphanes norvegica]